MWAQLNPSTLNFDESQVLYRMLAHAIMFYDYVYFKATNTKWKYKTVE